MIVLLRLRNLTIFALVVLSLSFIYMGYTGFSDSSLVTEKNEKTPESSVEIISQPVQGNNTHNPLQDLDPLVNVDQLKNSNNFFVEFRMKKNKGRDAQIELLREIVNNPNSSQEVRNKAQDRLFVISESIAAEVKAENLLKAKGYEEVVVLVEPNNTTVVVKKENLTPTDITRIGDLVIRATGSKLEQIAIIPKQ